MLKKNIQSPSQRFVVACLVLLIFFGVKVYIQEQILAKNHPRSRQIDFQAQVVREVFDKNNSQELVVRSEEGLVQVRIPKYPSFKYGDIINIRCTRFFPDALDKDGAHYGRYLRMQGINWVCKNSEVEWVGYKKILSLRYYVIFVRKKIAQTVENIWPEPHASFIAGILYGERKGMSKDLKDKFAITGLTHIMAVSGYNVTIVANIILAFLAAIGVRRKRAFGFVLVGVAFFVVLVGGSASAVRAGIMGVVALLGRTLGRGNNAAALIISASIIMTLHNEMVLLYDVGFHLSVLATIGLIYFSPIIEKFLRWVPGIFGLREIISTSVSAIIFTAPLISFVFGKVTVVSLITNVLVLPVIPILMLLSGVAMLFGLFLKPAGVLLGVVAWLLSSYVLLIVKIFSELSFASLSFAMPLWVVIISYLILWILIFQKNKLLDWLES